MNITGETQKLGVAQPTPGPWVTDDEDAMYVIDAEGSIVCDLGLYGEMKPWRGFKNYEANARLLAAAPDLLKTLKHVARLEAEADELARAGMVDYAHVKALRAASKLAREAVLKVTLE